MSSADTFSDKTVSLLSFSADWCVTCHTMDPMLDYLVEDLEDKLAYREVDIDKSPMNAAAFQIRSVPTLLLFKSGKILWRHAGLIAPQDLKSKLKSICNVLS